METNATSNVKSISRHGIIRLSFNYRQPNHFFMMMTKCLLSNLGLIINIRSDSDRGGLIQILRNR